MAETKQGGFHAFEQRVHQIEEADREAERKGQTKEGAGASRETRPAEKGGAKEPTRK
jgi:hypothetical protein